MHGNDMVYVQKNINSTADLTGIIISAAGFAPLCIKAFIGI